jgi:hypothetical protein
MSGGETWAALVHALFVGTSTLLRRRNEHPSTDPSAPSGKTRISAAATQRNLRFLLS